MQRQSRVLKKLVAHTGVLSPSLIPENVGDGNSEAPPLRRESSQGFHGSCVKKSGNVKEDCTIGAVVERELVLVVSVRCGKERDMTRG